MNVELIDIMGSDLTVVNAARVSFNKHHEEVTDGDKKLLAQHKKQLPDKELSGNKIITNNDIKKLKLAEG